MYDREVPFYTGIILNIVCAVEIFIIIPVFVANRAKAAALEVLLNEVDNVLEVKVVSIALDQFLRQLLLQELSQFVGINEPQGDHQHLRQEEQEETEGVKPRNTPSYNDL